MNTFEVKYDGNLRTTAIHLDSGSKIQFSIAIQTIDRAINFSTILLSIFKTSLSSKY